MFRLLLIAAVAVLAPAASVAQMPGCQVSFHAVASDGAPVPDPVVAAQHVLEVREQEAEAESGLRRFLVTLDDTGSQALAAHTAANIGQLLAMGCDGVILSQQVIREPMRSPVFASVDVPVGHPPGVDDLDAPQEILAWVDLPRSVALGDSVTLRLTVSNARSQGEFRVSSVDIGDGFLDGFEILDITPAPQAREHTLGVLALALPTDIAAGTEWTLEIRLAPRRAGVFIGDVDIWAGGRFLTRVAQIQVR